MNFDPWIVRIGCFGKQRFTKATLVMCDQVGGCTEDMGSGAVVALQLDDDCAGKVLFEAKNIVHFRSAPAVNRLIVVADATQIDFISTHAEFAALIGPAGGFGCLGGLYRRASGLRWRCRS